METYSDAERAALAAAIDGSAVGYVVDIGYDVPSSALAARHAREYPWCYAAVGVHPSDVGDMDEAAIEELRALAAMDGVVAIGEIGLDYHYDDAPSVDMQRHWFARQLALGMELGMPVAIHDRDTNGETMEILEREGAFSGSRCARFAGGGAVGSAGVQPDAVAAGQPGGCGKSGGGNAAGADAVRDARILLHCFSGSADEALAAIEKGAWISVAGPVTYKNNHKTQEVAAAVPLSRLLIETDSPYLTPVPHRGKPNMPPYVEFTARKIAELRGITYEEVAAATTENAKLFYGIQD
jgi:TatD DNase family protein